MAFPLHRVSSVVSFNSCIQGAFKTCPPGGHTWKEMLLLQSWILITSNLHQLQWYNQEVQQATQCLQLDIWYHVAAHLWKRDWTLMLNVLLMTNFPHPMTDHPTVLITVINKHLCFTPRINSSSFSFFDLVMSQSSHKPPQATIKSSLAHSLPFALLLQIHVGLDSFNFSI